MIRRLTVLLPVFLLLAGCRQYQLESKLTSQDGLIPPDQYARYGREQAEGIAIAREYGRTEQADAAIKYARTLPDVADIDADPLGYRLTIRFASGWRLAVNPVRDGKRGADTPGVSGAGKGQSGRR